MAMADHRGVFRGGLGAMAPPLHHQYSKINKEYYLKLRHGPLFVTWVQKRTKSD